MRTDDWREIGLIDLPRPIGLATITGGAMRITTTLVATAALALGPGCGYDTDKDAAGRLTPEQYAAILPVLEAQAPYDDATSPDEMKGAAGALARACDPLGGPDPLLAAFAETCGPMVDYLRTLTRFDCPPERVCTGMYDGILDAMRGLIGPARDIDAVIVEHVDSEACRDALSPPGSTDAMVEAQRTFERAVDALRGGDLEDLLRASEDLDSVEASIERYGKARQQLERFRDACRPK